LLGPGSHQAQFSCLRGELCAGIEALTQAFDAEDGKDVRMGGGVATVRQFPDADLIDTLHIAVTSRVELGRGERLWTGPDELLDRFHLEQIPSPSRVVHHIFWHR
jgi:dihydrofolate reductase